MGNIISTDGLKFLDIITYPEINIEENKATFITGESGCGKSTLLRLINATLIPSAGTIFYKNESISKNNKIALRKQVLLVPQEVYLIDGTIKDNFEFYYSNRDEQSPTDEVIKKFLKLCCIAFSPDANCSTMSGGERQRVFLAIFISFMPSVLLLDEPTSALDAETANNLLSSIKNYCFEKAITLVAVCHSKELTEKFADNQILLKR